MPVLTPSMAAGHASASRPLVASLFVASCLLSIVSWYTTQQGMALYLSPWFALLASLGVQSSLVLVAWLVGFNRSRSALLISVYVITAVVSIAFSYVSLYTWFSARERPATVERRLYDALNAATGKSQELLAAAIGEGQKHVLALDEMTAAEKAHGYISRAEDSDPYLARIRQSVAREAETYAASYPEGTGPGLRYTAFDRYAKMAVQSVARLQQAQQALSDFRSGLKPLDSTESQLRAFHQVYDAIPWSDVRDTLHSQGFEVPAAPAYSDFVDRSSAGQEDLLIAFSELFTASTGRHVFAFALAAFIDIIVFLLAYAAGPFFYGAPEDRWFAAGAALDSADEQVFLRDLVRKLVPGSQGLARVEESALSPGELQLLLLLTAKGLAARSEENGRIYYLLDQSLHQRMVESLAVRGLSLHATAQPARG
ncbi:MAG: hypothetical protein DMF80_13990 [Acidobacteria bacterium]|nr:MAG: hypothetical protein DMF80_13990 [Acidobacteriota bacterium]